MAARGQFCLVFESCLLFGRYHSRSIEGRSDGMVKLDTIEGFGSVRRCRNGVGGGRGRCRNCGTHAEWLGTDRVAEILRLG